MVCLWIGYKMFLIISEKLHKSRRTYKNEMTQTSNEDFGQQKVVYLNRDSGYRTSRSSYQSSISQGKPLFNDYQKHRYDISGDNHCFACTVVNYKNLADRQSAKNDQSNLKKSMEARGYKFTPCTGYVTLEDFKNKLLTELSRMTTATTSFVVSLSCHGDSDRLVFSDGKR